MYKISYEKCVCLIFLVFLAFLSCSGFHIDRMIPLPDHNKKYLYPSSSLNDSAFVSDFTHPQRDQVVEEAPTSLVGSLPLQELQRAYGRRRKRRIRNTRSRSHRERHSDSNDDRNPSPYQKPTQSDSRKPTRNQRRGRKHQFCPGQDVATRAYLAKTVLEGRIRSKTKNLSARSTYNVTYEVKMILKDQSRFKQLGKNESIRLTFANERGSRAAHCDFREINGAVPAQFNISKNYVLFADRIGDHEYKILGPPVESTRRNLQEIRNIVEGKAKGK